MKVEKILASKPVYDPGSYVKRVSPNEHSKGNFDSHTHWLTDGDTHLKAVDLEAVGEFFAGFVDGRVRVAFILVEAEDED